MSAIAQRNAAATPKSTVRVEQVNSYLGAEVSGIDLSQPMSEPDLAALQQAHAQYEVLVFRDQPLTAERFMDFGSRFGRLSVHPFSPNDKENPELILFRNDENTPPWKTDCWHSDETFRKIPPMGTMLHALDVPAFGGDTMFVSMTAAWEGLSDRMQHFLSGLEAYHDFLPFKEVFGMTPEGREKLLQYERDYPPSLHPVVAEHPVTGRKLIFVNPQFTTKIKGMGDAESQQLLTQLFDLAKVPEYQYRHHWYNGTLAFWDNRSTQHYAVHDYFPKRRFMQRVTIAGTQSPQPAFAPADPEAVRDRKSRAPSQLLALHGGHAPKKGT
ncbi:MAG: TauD/TfdA family dioxygenase [Hyphomicrobiales bacterium]|nr:TauD/TfdA family dioxygenase [Hyphomicrobiales bacterium]